MFNVLLVVLSAVHASTLEELKNDLFESVDLLLRVGTDRLSPANDSPIARALLENLQIPETDPLFGRLLNAHSILGDDRRICVAAINDARVYQANWFEDRLSALLESKLHARSVVDMEIEEAMETNKSFIDLRTLTHRLRRLNCEIDAIEKFGNDYSTNYKRYKDVVMFASKQRGNGS